MRPVELPANAPGTRASRVADFVRMAMGLRPDKAYQLVIKTDTRSAKQNRAWHGIVVKTIADHARDHFDEDHGYDVWHAYLRDKFIPAEEHRIGRTDVTIRASTASLSRAEFADLFDRVQAWAARSMDLYIPDPDPEYKRKRAESTTKENKS